MANTVVPKREPCKVCSNPVFFAERLVIHNSLYHRSCFKCARCNSVLTYGNFYETEKDYEYCCETCPDEEKTSKNVESNRLTIAQRVAHFERESSAVLKKSLSDEEKSNRPTPSKSEALTSFLTTQISLQKSVDILDSLSSESKSDEGRSTTSSLLSGHLYNNLIPISDNNAIKNHKNTSESSNHSMVYEEPTRTQNIEAVVDLAHTCSEFQAVTDDTSSAHIFVEDMFTKETEVSSDNIEMLFEQLAEDAVKSPVISIPLSKQPQTPNWEDTSAEGTDLIGSQANLEPELSLAPETTEGQIFEHNEKNLNKYRKSSKGFSAAFVRYPEELDPFGNEDENLSDSKPFSLASLNPFESCSEYEGEKENDYRLTVSNTLSLPKPASTNPFSSDDEEDNPQNFCVRTPVPTPRKQAS